MRPPRERARRLQELRRALAAVPPGRFEAWVTHQFVLQAAGSSVSVLARATLH